MEMLMVSWRGCRRPSSKALIGILALPFLLPAIAAWVSTGRCEPENSCPELGVMLNPANPVNALSLDELRAIYSGQRIKWPGGGKIIVIAAPDESLRARLFNQRVFGRSRRPRTLRDSPIPFQPLILSRQATRQYVRLFRDAIAYGWRDSQAGGVKWIAVDGLGGSQTVRCRGSRTHRKPARTR